MQKKNEIQVNMKKINNKERKDTSLYTRSVDLKTLSTQRRGCTHSVPYNIRKPRGKKRDRGYTIVYKGGVFFRNRIGRGFLFWI